MFGSDKFCIDDLIDGLFPIVREMTASLAYTRQVTEVIFHSLNIFAFAAY